MRWGRLRPSVLRVLGIPFLAQPARLSIGYSPEISLRSVGKCRNIASPLVHGIVGAIARFRRLSPLVAASGFSHVSVSAVTAA